MSSSVCDHGDVSIIAGDIDSLDGPSAYGLEEDKCTLSDD